MRRAKTDSMTMFLCQLTFMQATGQDLLPGETIDFVLFLFWFQLIGFAWESNLNGINLCRQFILLASLALNLYVLLFLWGSELVFFPHILMDSIYNFSIKGRQLLPGHKRLNLFARVWLCKFISQKFIWAKQTHK